MERRLGGMVALLLAVVATVVVPQILRPGVDGSAAAAPPPVPPDVGSCVTLGLRNATLVDCAQPHDGEVFVTWTADDPARPSGRHSLACTDELAERGMGTPARMDDWEPTFFSVSTRLIRAPRSERIGDRGWAACVLRPADQSRYEGTVLDLPPNATERPGAFGACSSGSLHLELPCTTPHAVERLGTASGSLPAADAVELGDNGLPAVLDLQLRASCRTLAAELVGSADPTFGARLTVDVVRSSMVPAISASPDRVAWSVDCILSSGDLPLVDSVVGVADGALPVG